MDPRIDLFIEKAAILRQAGYALIAVGLILLIFLGTTPSVQAPRLGFYSYLLIAFGGIAVVLYKCTEALQYSRLKKRTAYCLECGWFGRGTDWYRYAGCPECESERVDLR